MTAPKHAYAAVSGSLLASAPLPFAVLAWTPGAAFLPATARTAIAIASALSLALGAASLIYRPGLARALAVLGGLGMLALGIEALRDSPALALACTTFVAWMANRLGRVQHVGGPRATRAGRALGAAARSSAFVAWCTWLFAVIMHEAALTWRDAVTVGSSLALSVVLTALWALQFRGEMRERARATLAALAMSVLVSAGLLSIQQWGAALSALSLAPLAALLLVPSPGTSESTTQWDLILSHPERLLIVTFAGLCAAGALLLAMPLSSKSMQSIGLLDAAFTAVSAVCVTGLTVRDTELELSTFGHVVLLVLIQLGGLGIMTFSTAVMRVLGRRMSLKHEGAAARLVSTHDTGHAFRAARMLIGFTFACELLGALLLAPRFYAAGDSAPMAAWRAVFTSISAFCNAGFALQSSSLIAYRHDALILHVIGMLIVVGGLSPAVALALPDLVRSRGAGVSAQVKLVLSTTAILLVVGFALFLGMEWTQTLRPLPLADRLHNAWFQSVTLRTAGFNSIDTLQLREATACVMILWMFVGGSPGSTAGGIKTTTAAILVLSVVSTIRGQPTVTAFRRTLGAQTLQRATAIVTLGLAAGFIAVLAMLLTQDMPAIVAVFEVVSAMGTVGLTIGGTALLDEVGKLIIMICMFSGRVGPLTLFMLLSRGEHTDLWRRPVEQVDVG